MREKSLLSLTRILAIVGFAAFLVCSFYLMYKNQSWVHYDTFATWTGGGGLATQLLNKLMNSKLNTGPGEVGKPTE
jgi:hypothetical protein